MDRDVLSTIPGALLSAALDSLPDAASSENTPRLANKGGPPALPGRQ